MNKKIIGLCAVALLVLFGLWLWTLSGDSTVVRLPPPPPSAPFAVETVEEFDLVRTFDPGVKGLKGIALDAGDNLYTAGASGVKQFIPSGMEFPGPATCVTVDGEGNVYVGEQARVEVFDRDGKLRKSFGKEGRHAGELSCVTGIAVYPKRAGEPVTDILVADAGNRCIHRFDMTGDFVEDIGKPDHDAGIPGLVCTSAYLDAAVDDSGVLHVTNPGMTRVERYSLDGKLLGFWGEGGNEPQQFSGCCNPTNIALMPEGRVAVSEKITARVKIYDANGKMLAFIGPEHFTKNAAGLGLAVDSAARLWVMDPGDGKVRVFARKKSL